MIDQVCDRLVVIKPPSPLVPCPLAPNQKSIAAIYVQRTRNIKVFLTSGSELTDLWLGT